MCRAEGFRVQVGGSGSRVSAPPVSGPRAGGTCFKMVFHSLKVEHDIEIYTSPLVGVPHVCAMKSFARTTCVP